MNTSGIVATEETKAKFKEFGSSNDRSLVLAIKDEAVHPEHVIPGSLSLQDDWSAIANKLSEKECRYIILRDGDGKLIFISFVPDSAHVRSKMLYASSSSNLQSELGKQIPLEANVFWTDLTEVSEEGWKGHLAHEKAVNPLSEEEASLQRALDLEVEQMLGTAGRKSHVGEAAVGTSKIVGEGAKSIPIKVSDDADDLFKKFAEGTVSVVGFGIDLASEVLEPRCSGTGSLSGKISSENPQYTFYKPANTDAAAFIYTCPSNSKVKERMVYALSKKAVIQLANQYGIIFAAEIEESNAVDVTEEAVKGHLGVEEKKAEVVHKPRFSKPRAPGRR